MDEFLGIKVCFQGIAHFPKKKTRKKSDQIRINYFCFLCSENKLSMFMLDVYQKMNRTDSSSLLKFYFKSEVFARRDLTPFIIA